MHMFPWYHPLASLISYYSHATLMPSNDLIPMMIIPLLLYLGLAYLVADGFIEVETCSDRGLHLVSCQFLLHASITLWRDFSMTKIQWLIWLGTAITMVVGYNYNATSRWFGTCNWDYNLSLIFPSLYSWSWWKQTCPFYSSPLHPLASLLIVILF